MFMTQARKTGLFQSPQQAEKGQKRLALNNEIRFIAWMSNGSIMVAQNQQGDWVIRGAAHSGPAQLVKFNHRAEAVRKARKLGQQHNVSVYIQTPSGVFLDRHVAKPASAEHIKRIMRESMAAG
jgi:hypothetical protein